MIDFLPLHVPRAKGKADLESKRKMGNHQVRLCDEIVDIGWDPWTRDKLMRLEVKIATPFGYGSSSDMNSLRVFDYLFFNTRK